MRPKPSEILALYESGLSSRQIASTLGIGKTTVWKICRGLRTRSIAAMLRQPHTTKHWRSCRAHARRIVSQHLGRRLDSSEHVHHKDSDYSNNEIDNLQVLSRTEHLAIHKPKNLVPRHLRPERKAYMKAYLKEYRRTYRRAS